MNKIHYFVTAIFFAAAFALLWMYGTGKIRDAALMMSLAGSFSAWVAAMQFGGGFDR